ncbi:carboxymuconolactone decarboxylase family protein, partial [Staphylococcus condimenti]
AYCLSMHTSDARKLGVSEEEIFPISMGNQHNV